MEMRLLALIPVGLAATTCTAAFTFGDIDFWVGQGSNEAALVIDWNGGPEPVSLVWGFRFDGAATGADMLTAVINADANLYGRFSSFSFGDVLIGLGYDLDGDGFSISDGTEFGSGGVAFTGTSDGATADDPDDHYVEGWNTGFWSYWLGSGDPYDGGAWDSSLIGFGDRVLSDGDWDGYRFAPGFIAEQPREPIAAIPGPSGVVVLGVGVLGCSRRRRR